MSQRKSKINYKDFLKNPQIKEHTAYLVNVCYKSVNPIHEAILFVGFRSGGYCEIYVNNYEMPNSIYEVYDIEIIKELHTFK